MYAYLVAWYNSSTHTKKKNDRTYGVQHYLVLQQYAVPWNIHRHLYVLSQVVQSVVTGVGVSALQSPGT